MLRRLDESLALIETHQPWRLAHMRRDLNGFIVMRYACRGAFFPDQRVCMTELTFLARTDITRGACGCVDFARGDARAGARDGRRDESRDRAREERICRRAELDFGLAPSARARGARRGTGRASLQLEDNDVAPTIDWAEAKRRQDAIDTEAKRR